MQRARMKTGLRKSKNFSVWPLIITGVLGLIFLHMFLLWGPYLSSTWEIDPSLASQFGDFIGGYVGTVFIFVNIILLIFTLQKQTKMFVLQQFDIQFNTYLKLHRENVTEMQIGHSANLHGKKVFIAFVQEVSDAKEVLLKTIQKEIKKPLKEYDNREIINVSFSAFFYGAIGSLSKTLFINSLSEIFKKHQTEICKQYEIRRNENKKLNDGKPDPDYYSYFDGHLSRLPCYFSHLFSVFRLIEQNEKFINSEQYVQIVKDQLSPHELALLKLFADTKEGKNWNQSNYINSYKLESELSNSYYSQLIKIQDETESIL
jgi:hypothetical protein